jgi:hypothetical protein
MARFDVDQRLETLAREEKRAEMAFEALASSAQGGKECA